MFIQFSDQLVNTRYIVRLRKKGILYGSTKYLSIKCVLVDDEVIEECYEHLQKEERDKRFEALVWLLEIPPLDLGKFGGVAEEEGDCASE